MRWLHKINLNGVIGEMEEKHDLSCQEDDCPDEVKEALAKEVEKAPSLFHFAKCIREAQTIAMVNRVIQEVYDIADITGVWCGIKS